MGEYYPLFLLTQTSTFCNGHVFNTSKLTVHFRSRLAAVSVHVPSSEGVEEESHKDLILLICSIFLANQGAGEGTEEGKILPVSYTFSLSMEIF